MVCTIRKSGWPLCSDSRTSVYLLIINVNTNQNFQGEGDTFVCGEGWDICKSVFFVSVEYSCFARRASLVW